MATKIKLKPCKCGNLVEIKYICGLGGGLAKMSKNPFAGPMPKYYIFCENCGKSMIAEITATTITQRDKKKIELARAWNNRE